MNKFKLICVILIFDFAKYKFNVNAKRISELKCDGTESILTDSRSIYPFLVKIVHNDAETYTLQCLGTLISEDFVLVNANCITNFQNSVLGLQVRKFISSEEQYTNTENFSVKRVIKNELHGFGVHANKSYNIGLIQLDQRVFHHQVPTIFRPACLSSNIQQPFDTYRVFGFKDDQLVTTSFKTVDCSSRLFNVNLSNYICLNTSSLNTHLDFPVYRKIETQYYIFGIIVRSSSIKGSSLTTVLKFDDEIDWIESIVWPIDLNSILKEVLPSLRVKRNDRATVVHGTPIENSRSQWPERVVRPIVVNGTTIENSRSQQPERVVRPTVVNGTPIENSRSQQPERRTQPIVVNGTIIENSRSQQPERMTRPIVVHGTPIEHSRSQWSERVVRPTVVHGTPIENSRSQQPERRTQPIVVNGTAIENSRSQQPERVVRPTVVNGTPIENSRSQQPERRTQPIVVNGTIIENSRSQQPERMTRPIVVHGTPIEHSRSQWSERVVRPTVVHGTPIENSRSQQPERRTQPIVVNGTPIENSRSQQPERVVRPTVVNGTPIENSRSQQPERRTQPIVVNGTIIENSRSQQPERMTRPIVVHGTPIENSRSQQPERRTQPIVVHGTPIEHSRSQWTERVVRPTVVNGTPIEYSRTQRPIEDSRSSRVKPIVSFGTSSIQDTPNVQCGQRKPPHKAHISFAQPTYSGEFAWHIALNRDNQYICGGTIISRMTILTAAHCVHDQRGVVPANRFIVVAGTNNLIEYSIDTRSYVVKRIIVYEKYNRDYLEHDIAILKLTWSIEFSIYVQPICISNMLDYGSITMGLVAGWGRNEYNQLSNELLKATLPIVDEFTCRESNREFFSIFLNSHNYCAGYDNGTNVCSGDSGGAMIFEHNSQWYIRGIVSLGVALNNILERCDITQLVLFTDVPQYYEWIIQNLGCAMKFLIFKVVL